MPKSRVVSRSSKPSQTSFCARLTSPPEVAHKAVRCRWEEVPFFVGRSLSHGPFSAFAPLTCVHPVSGWHDSRDGPYCASRRLFVVGPSPHMTGCSLSRWGTANTYDAATMAAVLARHQGRAGAVRRGRHRPELGAATMAPRCHSRRRSRRAPRCRLGRAPRAILAGLHRGCAGRGDGRRPGAPRAELGAAPWRRAANSAAVLKGPRAANSAAVPERAPRFPGWARRLWRRVASSALLLLPASERSTGLAGGRGCGRVPSASRQAGMRAGFTGRPGGTAGDDPTIRRSRIGAGTAPVVAWWAPRWGRRGLRWRRA